MSPPAILAITMAAFVLGTLAGRWWSRRQMQRTRLASLVFDNTDLGIVVTDPDARIVAVNPAYCRMSGFEASELVGQNPSVQKSGRHDESFYRELWRTLESNGQWQGEMWNRRKNGQAYPAWQNISAVKNRHGRTVQYLAVVSDITPVKAVQERLDHLAHHDPLTGLPNRLLFMATLERSLAHAERQNTSVALLFVDLDHFKSINDTLGHDAGDQLLIEVARRLQHAIRAADLVARLGGDEFVVTLDNVREREEAGRIACKLLVDLQAPMAIAGKAVAPAASIGIALYPQDASTPATLLNAADDAMYEAKRQGRHSFAFPPGRAA